MCYLAKNALGNTSYYRVKSHSISLRKWENVVEKVRGRSEKVR